MFPDGGSAANLAIELFEISMKPSPSIVSIARGKTDEKGQYSFKIPIPQKRAFFRLNVEFQNQFVGSAPVLFEVEKSTLKIDITLPKKYQGIEHLDFIKEILIFDILADAVRVTEIINFVNTTDGLVDAKRIPYVKKIPEAAYNVELFNKQEWGEVTTASGQIEFHLMVPEGRHQLFFSYDLAVNSDSLELENYFPPALDEFEIMTPEEAVGLFFLKDGDVIRDGILQKQKKLGDRVYYSKIINPADNQKKITVLINHLPMSQKRLYYPAIILLILLMSGLFWFLKKKPFGIGGS